MNSFSTVDSRLFRIQNLKIHIARSSAQNREKNAEFNFRYFIYPNNHHGFAIRKGWTRKLPINLCKSFKT